MIKCPHCGSPLQIEQAFCPYCGSSNEYFQKHREDMAEYEQEFQQARTDVYNKTNQFAGTSVSIVIICVLVVLNLAVFALSTQARNIAYDLKEKAVLKDYDLHIEMLDGFIAEENYIALREYFYENNLYYADEMDEYRGVLRYADLYGTFYSNLMQSPIGYDSEVSFQHSVEFMADAVSSMIEMNGQDVFYDEAAYSDEHIQTMNAIWTRTTDMLRAYAGFSQEDLDQLETYSKGQIMILLEEGIPYHEMQK